MGQQSMIEKCSTCDGLSDEVDFCVVVVVVFLSNRKVISRKADITWPTKSRDFYPLY